MKNWLKNKKFVTSLITLASLFSVSCSTSSNENISAFSTPVSAINANAVKNNYVETPVISSEFIGSLKKQNINLNTQEVSLLNKLIKIQPTGEWTPGPENDSKANLKKHFIKHGKYFKPVYETQEEYLQGAIKASKNDCEECNSYFDTKYYHDEKMVSVVRWNPKTLDFSVTRDNGQIATYFVNKVKSPRFILIPKNNKEDK